MRSISGFDRADPGWRRRWLDDHYLSPERRKRMVCIAPRAGFFFRINSQSHWPVAVPIDCARHRFLSADSFVECWAPLEFDDAAMDTAFAEGVPGRVHSDVLRAIWHAASESELTSEADKQTIRNALQIR